MRGAERAGKGAEQAALPAQEEAAYGRWKASQAEFGRPALAGSRMQS